MLIDDALPITHERAPQAVFFLGDGGWDAAALIQTAQGASATIHSIAFFTSGGGLKEIAAMTSGTYREINGEADLAAATAPSTTSSGGGGGGGDDSSSGDEDSDDDDDDDDSDGDEGGDSEDDEDSE